jgi:hypothetical protein
VNWNIVGLALYVGGILLLFTLPLSSGDSLYETGDMS